MQFDIRRFDIYRKVPKDLTQPTLTGACISISSVLFILYLFLSELSLFLTHEVISELTVEDPVRHTEKIPVFINITLPQLKCEYLGIDIQDDMGRHEVGFQDDTQKIEVNEGKGCRMESHFVINKVPGNFHVSTHSSRTQPDNPDMTHLIHKVRFGMDLQEGKEVKGSFNPLEDVDRSAGQALATHNYIVKIVPSVYEDKRGNVGYPYQYTYSYREVMQYGHGGRVVPAIWFRYELSPITVRYIEKNKPFYTFLTTVCAIVGGTFTVAGILDSCIFTAAEIFKKAELGKLS
ncbi:endoplasmic reticulum-Golgi intermediate compartment protein 1-like isoform X1 [Mytilus californianus]|uniref:endoplasmic reticulum-Golgi intermediate compartment protein 1-like isoform X1 n=1 Tax=Mytilus californianus TaxID=6549 RepID=UPI0022464315|nr:endoplasmic reticulum-Golgi intermediate compartment protein 1-like isoform X1 [Mytilus californianus]